MDRIFAEGLLTALTGGGEPSAGDTVEFDPVEGWIFKTPSVGSPDFYILSPGFYIAADPLTASAKPYGYRWILCPPTVYHSIKVQYDLGGGAVQYTYDYAAIELHNLKQTGGINDVLLANDQLSFLIVITPYTGTGGTGTAGTPISLYTGDSLRSGRGVTIEKSDGSLLTGNFFKLPPHLDADLDAADDYEPLGRLKVTYNAGSVGGSWTPDYLNGPTQKVTASAALTLANINNFPDGGVMNMRFYLASTYTLTISGTYFEGPTLSFTGVDTVALTIVNFGTSKYAIAGVSY